MEGAFEVCILAGGLSERMGRDKARLRLGRWTLLGRVRVVAKELGVPVRVVRRDLVPRCGPLGGVYTGLKTTRAEAVLFLSCDMPFVSTELLEQLRDRFAAGRRGVFVEAGGVVGFPFLLPTSALEKVAVQLAAQRHSLQALARGLRAVRLRLGQGAAEQLFNVNTPDDFARAQMRWREGLRGGTGRQRARAAADCR